MRLKIKFTAKYIFYYFCAGLVIANLVGLYFLYKFGDKYVYQTIFPDENALTTLIRGNDDINLNRFDAVMKKLDEKLFTELHSGAKIVSYLFPIPNRVPIVKEDGIFVYQV